MQEKKIIKTDGKVKGNYKEYDNFVYAIFYNAGHGVPRDQPEAYQ